MTTLLVVSLAHTRYSCNCPGIHTTTTHLKKNRDRQIRDEEEPLGGGGTFYCAPPVFEAACGFARMFNVCKKKKVGMGEKIRRTGQKNFYGSLTIRKSVCEISGGATKAGRSLYFAVIVLYTVPKESLLCIIPYSILYRHEFFSFTLFYYHGDSVVALLLCHTPKGES